MLSKVFGGKARGFILRVCIELGKELLKDLPLPLISKLSDGKLTTSEIRELAVLIAGEAVVIFEEEYRKTYGEPINDDDPAM